MNKLQAPFPYFGGKSTIAADVWYYLGDVNHYLEPFFGSGAVLLARPKYNPKTMVESVCDSDGLLCNVWRSLQFAPDEVARWCDWPINHADLMTRRKALIKNEERLLKNLVADEKWYDAVMAGYWIWAASCWIGSGLTRLNVNTRPHLSSAGMGINALGKKPHLSSAGVGINALGKRPDLGCAGKGINALGKRPHLSDAGVGINALGKRPDLGCAGKGVQEPYNTHLYTWFRQLSERLRYVRVVCGDWTRICGGDWQDKQGIAGIFFDPPYGVLDRDTAIYHHDSTSVAQEVNQWCLERGSRKTYRIVLAGYYEEHENLLAAGWTVKRWEAQGGYGNTSRNGKQDNQGKTNRLREALFISPYCRGYKAANFKVVSDFFK